MASMQFSLRSRVLRLMVPYTMSAVGTEKGRRRRSPVQTTQIYAGDRISSCLQLDNCNQAREIFKSLQNEQAGCQMDNAFHSTIGLSHRYSVPGKIEARERSKRLQILNLAYLIVGEIEHSQLRILVTDLANKPSGDLLDRHPFAWFDVVRLRPWSLSN